MHTSFTLILIVAAFLMAAFMVFLGRTMARSGNRVGLVSMLFWGPAAYLFFAGNLLNVRWPQWIGLGLVAIGLGYKIRSDFRTHRGRGSNSLR